MDALAHSLVVGDTRVFGSNTVNSLRFSYNRSGVFRLAPATFDPYDIGSDVYSYQPDAGVFIVSGNGFQVNNPGPSRFTTDASQVSNDLTLVRGDHQLALGGNLAYWKFSFQSHARSGGNWNFTGQLTGLGLADFMIGACRPAGARRAGAPADESVVRGPLRSGHLARESTGHAQWRPALGAVLRAERHQRRGLQLQPRELPEQRQKPAIRERTRRVHLPWRYRVPGRTTRHQHAVVELLPACGLRLGRRRRRPYRGARVVRAHLRLPECGISAHQRELAAVRQPHDRGGPSGTLRSACTRTSAGIRTRFSRTATPSSFRTAHLVPSTQASTRRVCSSGT